MKILYIFFFLLLCLKVPAQVDMGRPQNHIYLNILGDGIMLSINYDHTFKLNSSLMLSGKIGCGFGQDLIICTGGPCDDDRRYLALPLHITINYGAKKHLLEAGFGLTHYYNESETFSRTYPIIGYRFQPIEKNKFFLRGFFNIPFSSKIHDALLFSPVGLAFGGSF